MFREKDQSTLVTRQAVRVMPDKTRVISRSFILGGGRAQAVLRRVLAVPEDDVPALLEGVMRDFDGRHKSLQRVFECHFLQAAPHCANDDSISRERRLLIGAYFTLEYSLESVALFNPSMVAHPDQSDLEEGCQRFIMSLRACGEGHVSSIEFRMGIIEADGEVRIDPVSAYAVTEQPVEDKRYNKRLYYLKLIEMGAFNRIADAVLADLEEGFTLAQLNDSIDRHRRTMGLLETFPETAENMLWLAHSNYHLLFPEDAELSERVIFPVTDNESRGIEDARFVRFTDDDGEVTYYATYAAFNGFRSLPQFIETTDFTRFKITTLNGKFAQDKGMALFPRKVGGEYAMIARVDGESLYLLTSNDLHFWDVAQVLSTPTQPWELMQLGNCGSPIETPKGWLLLTHGVGPMRKYCIGALLLDLEDPIKVIARMNEPLMVPNARERDGYVPNVLYTCGAMLHGDLLVIPYAFSDTSSSVATVRLPDLLGAMTPC